MISSTKKDVPNAPECPKEWKVIDSKVNIKYRKGKKNSCGITFKREYVEYRIIREIESFSISTHHEDLRSASLYFRRAMQTLYPDSQCWITGSYAAGVDIHTSDLDFTVKVPCLNEENSFKKLLSMRENFNRVLGFSRNYVQKGFVPVLQLKHIETRVSIDVSIDNDSSKRNTQLLSWYGQLDSRFPILCKAMKSWASKVEVEGANKGRLNSFSLCLMLIQYLQEVKPAVLPNIQHIFPELNGEFTVENDEYERRNLKEKIIEKGSFEFDSNKSSVAALFLGFLNFYAEFDFSTKWISVKNGNVQRKEWDDEKRPLNGLPDNCRFIVVEDPFLEVPRNCAGTVRQSSFVERIQLEFKKEYDRILKNNTIFNLQHSNWRRILTENGKKRDLQIVKIDDNKEEERRKKAENIPWGTPFEGEWIPKRPKPETYWNLETKWIKMFEKTPEWPECCNMFDLLDSEISL
uniref:PAP-associated domain-containing protein n=1 Tax=Caenorhabditis tropicalis TaxID=1561998 RepID=A0A1I7UY08_9PELO